MRLKQLKKILKNLRLLWQALRKFNDDNGFFLSSGITFDILINLIPFIMLLLALVGTYLYNDQQVLNHIRAYFRDLAPTLDPKGYENPYGRHPEPSYCGNPGIGRFTLDLDMGLQLPADRSQYRVPGGEKPGNAARNSCRSFDDCPGRNPPSRERDSQSFCHLPAELPEADSRGYRADDSMDPKIPAPFFPHLLHVSFDLQNRP
jgi:hypothetical protein